MTRLSVRWACTDVADACDRLAVDEVARVCGTGTGQVSLSRLCPRCGSDRHGPAQVVAKQGSAAPAVSLSRTPGLAVAVVLADAPGETVGVDVERATALADREVSEVLLHAREQAETPEDLVVTWVRKEALLKAAGWGLVIDPATVRLSGPRQVPRILHWPETAPGRQPAWLMDLDLTEDVRAAVAGTGPVPEEVTITQARGEGPPG